MGIPMMLRLLPLLLFLAPLCALADAPSFHLDPGTAADWQTHSANSSPVEVKVVPGPREPAVRIDYQFKPGDWIEAARDLSLKPDNYGNITFQWRGTRTGVTFELKFADTDETVFGLKMPTRDLRENEWTKVTIPWKDLHVMWGGNQQLDPIRRVGFALSGYGGKGWIEISEFKSEPASGYSLELAVDQVGYHPHSRKEFVLRAVDLPPRTSLPKKLPFRVMASDSKKERFKGVAELQSFKDWPGHYYLGDFSGLEADGKYFVETELTVGGTTNKVRSFEFEIGPRVLSKHTAKLQFEFLKALQCGEKCHTVTPLKGGYHDTRFDISQRMWAIPSAVIGVSEYAKHADHQWEGDGKTVNSPLHELAYGVEFCAKFPEPDGTVSWGGIESDFKKAGLDIGQWLAMLGPLRPEEDKFERLKFKDKNLHATCFNLVAVMDGWPQVKKIRPDLEEAVRTTLKNSWEWIDQQPLKNSRDYGCYLDAAAACHLGTGDKKYLKRVPEVTQKLLALQALDYSIMERGACGDFFDMQQSKNFLWHYKTTSFNIAIHRSLLRLEDILTPEDPLYFPVRYANRVFAETYLKQMASKTPYRQLADNLEYAGDGKYKIYYFAGKKAERAAAGDHGLNCDHFALGWVALEWAKRNGDLDLQQLAEDQMHWALGKNPLNYSMMIGAGENNPVIVADFWNKTTPGTIINGPASVDGQSLEYKAEHFGHSEEWLPHNGDYLRLLGSLESDALLTGLVTDAGAPVEDADVRITCDGKKVFSGSTGKDGRWKSTPLPYGRRYEVKVSRGMFGGAFGDQVRYELDLVAGARRHLETRLDRHYALRIEKPALRPGIPALIKIHVENQTEHPLTPRLKVCVRGAELKAQPPPVGEIEGDEDRVLEYQVVPSGKEPFFFAVVDADQPQVSASAYELP